MRHRGYEQLGGCSCRWCRNPMHPLTLDQYGGSPRKPIGRSADQILAQQDATERERQRRARAGAQRSLRAVAGNRAPEVRAALSVRALSLKRAA